MATEQSLPVLEPSADRGNEPVLLSKHRPELSWPALEVPSGSMRVSLTWSPSEDWLGRACLIDLDLGCLYELADGTRGVVQALGKTFASHNPGTPLIALDDDDRGGGWTDGENLRIDLSRWIEIRRVLVFAYIYAGTQRWSDARALLTLYSPDDRVVRIPLDDSDDRSPMCAVFLLERDVAGSLLVRREMRYLLGTQEALDNAYGWGLTWLPMTKDGDGPSVPDRAESMQWWNQPELRSWRCR